MFKKVNFFLLALSFLLLSLIIYRQLSHNYIIQAKKIEDETFVAKYYEKLGFLTKEEFFKIRKIDQYIKSYNSISDSDLDWWIQLANKPGTSPIEQKKAPARRLAALDNLLMDRIKFSPQQKDRLFELSKIYLVPQTESEMDEDNKLFGVNLIAILDERRAVPNLQLLTHSPYPDIRDASKTLLQKWHPAIPKIKR